MMIEIDPAQLRHLRALFVLRRLSPLLQSDVLSDGKITEEFKIDVSHPVRLSGGITLERGVFFDLLQKVADGQASPTEVQDSDGNRLAIQMGLTGDTVTLTHDQNQLLFPQAALLTSSSAKRTEVAANSLTHYMLSSANRRAFEAIVRKDDFSHADFFAATRILAASPKTFADLLAQRARTGSLAKADFLPVHMEHWENLTAPLGPSLTLPDFTDHELAPERESVIANDPASALDRISLTFTAPELVPLDLLKKINHDALLTALQNLIESGDPFALAGGFDLCAERVASDARFAECGDRILDRLLANPKGLCGHFVPYATAFVIATAHLAQHQVLQRKPVFWRRLVAAAHAALVTRILGASAEEDESLMQWAMHHDGRTFYLSVMNDASAEARWRADWIEPRFLAADICGRLTVSSARLPAEARPPTWTEKLNSARDWILAEHLQLASGYPAILQGTAPMPLPPGPGTDAGAIYEEFDRTPTFDNFVMLTPLVWTFGFPGDARQRVLSVVQSLRTETAVLAGGTPERVLCLAACIAALNKDRELGEAVMQVCVERAATVHEDAALLFFVSTMVEAAAGFEDREQALATLARRFENLAYVSGPAAQNEFLRLLAILRAINEGLGNQLGRAIVTARLGRPRVASG